MPRPKTSQMVIDEFTKIVDYQDVKGFEKYGKSIDEANDDDYSWPIMALEEAADLQKYLVKEIQKLQINNEFLLKQLLDAKAIIRDLKAKSSFKRYEDLEKENLVMARGIEKMCAIINENQLFNKE
jgi:hypothetical protein